MPRNDNLQGLLTVYAQKKGAAEFTLDELNEILLEGLRFSLPFECAGEKMSPDLVTLAHSTAFKFFGEHSERLNTRLEVFLAPGNQESYIGAIGIEYRSVGVSEYRRGEKEN